MSNEVTIFIVSRPFGIMKGTGFERYSFDLYKKLKEANLNVIHISEVTFIGKLVKYGMKAYHSLLGLILFDLLMSIEFIIRIKTNRRFASRNDYIIHITEPLQGMFSPIFRKWLTNNIVITVWDFGTPRRFLDKLWSLAFVFSSKLSLSNAKKLIAISTQTKSELDRLNIPSEKVVTIPPGINEKFRPAVNVSEKFQRKIRVLGCVGNLFPRKRINKGIQVFKKLEETYGNSLSLKLIICGEGPFKRHLESLVSELGLSKRVEFLGKVPAEKMADLYNYLDVLLYPSKYEGFGYPVLEAQSCGVPVIVYQDSKIPDEVKKSCIKVENDYHAAKVIFKLLTEPAYYESISKESIEYTSNFRWNKIINEIIKLYIELLHH
jgi:glycosyltransferase involved in cell wall biosynthesis